MNLHISIVRCSILPVGDPFRVPTLSLGNITNVYLADLQGLQQKWHTHRDTCQVLRQWSRQFYIYVHCPADISGDSSLACITRHPCPHVSWLFSVAQLRLAGLLMSSLPLQEKGIPLMGESSFLASWFNRRAVMMGMFMCVCVCLSGSGPALLDCGMFLLPLL